MLVFEIVSLKDLNKFDQIIFSLGLLGKRFIRHYGKSLKTFPFWQLTFLLFKKVKTSEFGKVTESNLLKGLNVLAV